MRWSLSPTYPVLHSRDISLEQWWNIQLSQNSSRRWDKNRNNVYKYLIHCLTCKLHQSHGLPSLSRKHLKWKDTSLVLTLHFSQIIRKKTSSATFFLIVIWWCTLRFLLRIRNSSLPLRILLSKVRLRWWSSLGFISSQINPVKITRRPSLNPTSGN